jgi:CDP-diacylglycerol--glycerol-3-phosphate 3-phosphatidyltransferase
MRGPLLNLPNAISMVRVPLSLAACGFVASRDPVPACVLIFLAVISDFLDGLTARRTGSISDWGKILDPLADKVGIAALVITLTVVGALPPWFLAVVVVRDLLIAAGGMILTKRLGTPPSSNLWGKATSLCLSVYLTSVSVGWMLDSRIWPPEFRLWGVDPLGMVSLAFVVISFIVYFSDSGKLLRNA